MFASIMLVWQSLCVCVCSLAPPLRRAVKLCVGVGVVDSDGYSKALGNVLRHGLEMLRHTPSSPSSCTYDRLLWKLKLAMYIPVGYVYACVEY